MTWLASCWRPLAALLVVVGVVLLPLRAVAATIPMLIAYDAVAPSTSTTQVEMGHSPRPDHGGVAEYVYDCLRVGYDNPSNLAVVAGAAGVHTYDDALELLERRELAKWATYGAIEPTTAAEGLTAAAEGGGEAMTTLYRTVSEGERADIEAGGAYEAPVGGVEGKYFYPTAEQAGALAGANLSSQGVQTLTSVQVPTSMLQQAAQFNVATEGRVIFMTSEQLSGAPRRLTRLRCFRRQRPSNGRGCRSMW